MVKSNLGNLDDRIKNEINSNILSWKEKLKQYEFKGSGLECFSVDEY